jgi:putative hemolysin
VEQLGTLFEIGLVAILIIANGIFSGSETAVVSARRSRLQQRADSGDAGAKRALALSEDPNAFLATVQIGITLIGILSGAFGGARLSGPVADLLDGIPGIDRYADTLAFILVVLVITYLSLVVGELVPKRIALNNPENTASRIAAPMERLSRAVAPAVRLLSSSTDGLLRVLRVRKSDEPAVTAEEVGMLLEQGARAGVFHPAEREMTERIFAFAEDRVVAIMTPRPEVAWLDLEDSREDIIRQIIESPFSRFPVGRGDLDELLGVVRAKDYLAARSLDADTTIESIVKEPFVLPETTHALQALERFRQTGEHLAIVIDEYGGVAGIVTLQNILEAIVGDLPETGDANRDGAFKREDGSWLLEGKFQADEMLELLDLNEPAGADVARYETVAGFVLDQFGHIPTVGERFSFDGWIFEVVDMDGRRVDQVLATPPSAS